MEEIIDIFDENMNLLGTAPRKQAHAKGLWHKVFHCWVIRDDMVWLQKRGENVESHPNLLDISSAGHLQPGEDGIDGIREAREELGISIKEEDLSFIYINRVQSKRGSTYINNEFGYTYFFRTSSAITELTLLPSEVSGVYEAHIDDLLALFKGDTDRIDTIGIETKDGATISTAQTFGIKDFAIHSGFSPAGNDYYLEIFSKIKKACLLKNLPNFGKIL